MNKKNTFDALSDDRPVEQSKKGKGGTKKHAPNNKKRIPQHLLEKGYDPRTILTPQKKPQVVQEEEEEEGEGEFDESQLDFVLKLSKNEYEVSSIIKSEEDEIENQIIKLSLRESQQQNLEPEQFSEENLPQSPIILPHIIEPVIEKPEKQPSKSNSNAKNQKKKQSSKDKNKKGDKNKKHKKDKRNGGNNNNNNNNNENNEEGEEGVDDELQKVLEMSKEEYDQEQQEEHAFQKVLSESLIFSSSEDQFLSLMKENYPYLAEVENNSSSSKGSNPSGLKLEEISDEDEVPLSNGKGKGKGKAPVRS
eukprot:TRINITY_DN688_c0_g2_i3.p1 TRINITY_DN688_c0_g2~~TRINITY_DN688_c0_g2_i3.p1  ORF type:complete len:307 (-),score=120.64 TRINITY_DN688_c0_g2_i3:52-972(-)